MRTMVEDTVYLYEELRRLMPNIPTNATKVKIVLKTGSAPKITATTRVSSWCQITTTFTARPPTNQTARLLDR